MPQRVPSMAWPADHSGPTLIYDGECGICRQAVDLLRRWDRERVLQYVPFQDEAKVREFGIALPALAAAMHLVFPDGRVFAGADAIPALLRLLPRRRWLAPLFSLPGVMPAARRIYATIAARRHCLVRGIPPR